MSKDIVPVAFCVISKYNTGEVKVHYIPSARMIKGVHGYDGGDPIWKIYGEDCFDRFNGLIGLHTLTVMFNKNKLPEAEQGCRRRVYVKGVEEPRRDLDKDEYTCLKEAVDAEQVQPYYESAIYGWFGKSPKQPLQIELPNEPIDDSERAYMEFLSPYPTKDGLLLMELTMGELSLFLSSIEVGIDKDGTFVRLKDRYTKKVYKLRKDQEFCHSFASRIDYLERLAKSTNSIASLQFKRKGKYGRMNTIVDLKQ